MDCILGVDFGTTNIASVLIDLDSDRVVAQYSLPTEAYLTFKNRALREQSIGGIREKFHSCLMQLFKDGVYRVHTIGLTGQMHGILGIDVQGVPITNFVSWQDERGLCVTDEGITLIEKMNRRAGKRNIATGYGIVTLYDWIRRGLAGGLSKICGLPDYFGLILTEGRHPKIDYTMADSIGSFDLAKQNWDFDYLKRLGISSQLFPDIVPSASLYGELRDSEVSAIIGNRNVPITVAIGDNQASFVGSVQDYFNTLLINIGTGSQISFALEDIEEIADIQKIDGFDVVARPFVEGTYLIAGNALCGGASYAALHRFFKDCGLELYGVTDFTPLWQNMEKLAEAGMSKRNEDGDLFVSPLFSGKRSDPQTRGKIDGISLNNFKPAGLIFGTLQSIANVLKEMIDDRIIESKTYMVGSGNGLRKNTVLRKIISDLFHKPILIPLYEEEAAIGAALVGAVGAGLYRCFSETGTVIRYQS